MRIERIAVLAIAASVACSKNDERAGVRPPSPDEIPATLDVHAAKLVSGIALGRLRAVHDVRSFRITTTPVTVAQYRACVGAGACAKPERCGGKTSRVLDGPTYDVDERLPVTCAAPKQAEAYCAWIGGRLPTAEEWQLAARGPEVRRWAWGETGPACGPDASEEKTGCCTGDHCDDPARFAAGTHAWAVSPSGMKDALLTPGELIGVSPASHFAACIHGPCVVRGDAPGAIDAFVSDTDAPAYGFRCVMKEAAR